MLTMGLGHLPPGHLPPAIYPRSFAPRSFAPGAICPLVICPRSFPTPVISPFRFGHMKLKGVRKKEVFTFGHKMYA